MSISTIIVILGLKIILVNNATIPCNQPEKWPAYGCYFQDHKKIILGWNSLDINWTLNHEVGHALFLKDEKAKKIIVKYPPIRNFCTPEKLEIAKTFKGYGDCISKYSDKEIIDENVADYYAEYKIKNEEFKKKYPELYKFFNDKENKLKYGII